MPARGGTLVNTNAETVDTNWTKIELSASAADSSVGPYIDHFDYVGTPAGGAATLTYRFTYDTAGQDPFGGQESRTLTVMPGGTVYGEGRGIDAYAGWTRAGRTKGTLFLWMKVDVGTFALAQGTGVSVVWRDERGG